ncbi:MAG: hypothetical protein CMO61_11750 [Verrucomicrobiales bacterium]|nr:hypothetical protein [Verrucomicrobiales bacterium]
MSESFSDSLFRFLASKRAPDLFPGGERVMMAQKRLANRLAKYCSKNHIYYFEISKSDLQ